MDVFGNWIGPLFIVGALAAITLIFALFIGRWIDAQGNTVVGKPREQRKKRNRGG
jgi:hypothetical protein